MCSLSTVFACAFGGISSVHQCLGAVFSSALRRCRPWPGTHAGACARAPGGRSAAVTADDRGRRFGSTQRRIVSQRAGAPISGDKINRHVLVIGRDPANGCPVVRRFDRLDDFWRGSNGTTSPLSDGLSDRAVFVESEWPHSCLVVTLLRRRRPGLLLRLATPPSAALHGTGTCESVQESVEQVVIRNGHQFARKLHSPTSPKCRKSCSQCCGKHPAMDLDEQAAAPQSEARRAF
jgi:hypothetical protein